MPLNAVIIGALLFLLGPIFYLLAEPASRSLTAFIPSLFGILIAAFGLVSRTPSRLKAGMHGAATVALLGLLGSLRGVSAWPLLLTGRTAELSSNKVASGWATFLMFLLCGIFVAMCINWFRATRRAKIAR